MKAAAAFGPGFYGHDVVVETTSGNVFVCETALKFFPDSYMRKFRGLLDSENKLFSTTDWKDYAKDSAFAFVDYCAEILASSPEIHSD